MLSKYTQGRLGDYAIFTHLQMRQFSTGVVVWRLRHRAVDGLLMHLEKLDSDGPIKGWGAVVTFRPWAVQLGSCHGVDNRLVITHSLYLFALALVGVPRLCTCLSTKVGYHHS